MFAQQRPRSAGPGAQAAEPHRWSAAPVPAEVSLRRSRGGLEVVPGGYRAARGGSPPPQHHPPDTLAVLAAARDGSVPRARLLWAAALLLLEVIADDTPGDPDAAALAAELAGLLGEARRPPPAPAGPPPSPAGPPPWPAEPLTVSETRVLRYLPTHMGTPEIAAELFLSANTVKTHLRHLYRKLGAHNRREAVQRARAIGLLTAPSGRP
jgi:LuxR family transcriptional regulator, maltose regulon positive regulatory protein